ncbi:SDR family oxidoreductase [Chondromyces apiculatus]|uniref:DltE n=1 Tax=Chondromyces apiculatus DSM 436 TaxID=1192034 RepID=A0A017T9T7_9BACT|nr:SDR family NAD(P)-dependent oxidoreductase [Chondromyces apiculatus]EYF05702.1 DltE [Chondromyces apiculatus DSM 436]
MKLAGNTVLITGGGSGIGLAFAQRFLAAGSKVIVCGRRQDKLDEAKSQHPGLHTYATDVATEADRIALVERVTRDFPDLNVLVNNAGIQRRTDFLETREPWRDAAQEIAINLEAPIHLSSLMIPHLIRQQRPALVNVSSGLAFVPSTFAPVYGATKAALHSFTMSLRAQLADTPIEVVEIVPPAVNTDLGGKGLHTFGEPLDTYADAVMKRLDEGELEIGYGFAEKARKASREELDQLFAGLTAQVFSRRPKG